MFSSDEESKALDIYDNDFIVPVRHMIANAVLAGCRLATSWNTTDEGIILPKSAYYQMACNLGFIINRTLVHMIDSDKFSTVAFSENNYGHGRPIVEYQTKGICFHLKKQSNMKKLPVKADYRVEKAAANGQLLLDFGDEFNSKPIYMIVTYNHKRFKLKYIQVGVPKSDYSGWLINWDLMPFIQEDMIENVIKEYGENIREEYKEINKEYKISLK